MKPVSNPNSALGFTLVELAIVLIIVTLLTTGLITSLGAQRELAARSETERRLNDARDALLGFAAANGRLPCPATGVSGSTGIEDPVGGGACTHGWDGFLPAATLGLQPTDDSGYALDAWNNRIRYALTSYANASACPSPNFCFAFNNGVRGVWNLGTTPAPDLQVCSTATGMTGSGASATCASGTGLASTAVAVLFSRGPNGTVAPSSADEIANGNADRLFVSHTPTPAGTNEFDDIVVWLSPNILYNRMIAAGKLP